MMIKKLLILACGVTILGSSASASAGGAPYGAILAGARNARHHGGSYPGYCDYSNASNNGGWGWNPVTNSSCPPAHDQGYCDFSNAANSNGWGWNPVTCQSCR
jgi:hypothetical protein